jgi:hypothetical protein
MYVERSKLLLNLESKPLLFQAPIKSQIRQLKALFPSTLCALMASHSHALDGPKLTIYAMKDILFAMFDYIQNARTQTFEVHALSLSATIPFDLSFMNMESQIGVQRNALFSQRDTQPSDLHGVLKESTGR